MHHESLHQNSCNTVFPRDLVCFRNIRVDTLHKGDTEDDDNDDDDGDKKIIISTTWNITHNTESTAV